MCSRSSIGLGPARAVGQLGAGAAHDVLGRAQEAGALVHVVERLAFDLQLFVDAQRNLERRAHALVAEARVADVGAVAVAAHASLQQRVGGRVLERGDLVDVLVELRRRDQLDHRLRLDDVDRRPERAAVGDDGDRVGQGEHERVALVVERGAPAGRRTARRRRPPRAARAAPAPAPAPWRASARSRRSPAARAAAPRSRASGARSTA